MNDDTIEQMLLEDGERWRLAHDRPPNLRPGPGRRRWVPGAAAAGVLAVLAAAATVVALRDGPDPTPGHPVVDAVPCADSAASAAELLAEPPEGPASGKVAGSAVTEAWSLDGGALTVEPPPPNHTPALTHDQAACSLTAGVGIGHWGAGRCGLALATVSIRADVKEQKILGNFIIERPDRVPKLLAVPVYQRRVAWILITGDASSRPMSCGPGRIGAARPPATRNPIDLDHMRKTYAVYAVDAATGADAVIFTESHANCPQSAASPATVTVPYQRMSIAWTLQSRASDGKRAILSAAWADCERYGGPLSTNGPEMFGATVDQGTRNRVTIVINRPFGPPCGTPVVRSVRLTATETLPETLIHAPTGLLVWRP